MDSFEHFCPGHIGILVFIAAALITGGIYVKKLPERSSRILIRILSVLLFAGEMLQDILLIAEGGNFMEFLPLHLCNLGIFVDLAAAFGKGKAQVFFSEVSLVLILPGALCALLFPTWNYRPLWSYLPLLCFFTHTLLVAIPLFLLIRNKITVSFRHFHFSYIFLAVTAPPILLLDISQDLNYMFLNYPEKGTILQTVFDICGKTFYVPGLLVLVTIILLCEYAGYTLYGKIRRAALGK